MLERITLLAGRIRWSYPILIATAVIALVFAIWVMLSSRSGEGEGSALIPAVLVFSWSLLLVCFINLFRSVPPIPEKGERLARRILLRLHRATLALLALGFAALTLALLLVSYKLLTVWLSS